MRADLNFWATDPKFLQIIWKQPYGLQSVKILDW